MPTKKTTVTVQSPAGASARPPRITVNTGDAKTTRAASSSNAQKASTKSPPEPKPQPPIPQATATATTIDKKPWSNKGSLLAAASVIGFVLLCGLLYFSWKGIVGVSGEAITARLEKSVSEEHEKNRVAEKKRAEEITTSLASLEDKIEGAVKETKDASTRFAKKSEELERGMVALAEGMKEIRGQVASDIASFRKEVSKENEEFRKQTTEKVDSVATRIENKLKEKETPPPLSQIPPVQQEGTRAVTASDGKHFRFEGEELRPGEMSSRYCIDDIKAGKIEISMKPGIIARNHLHLWRSGWIDTPVPPSGTYVASPGAKYVSFYSLTDSFTVKRIRM